MVKTKEDLTGRVFGRLTVLKQTEDYIKPNGKRLAMWLCKCQCGKENFKVLGDSLRYGNTQSCGCLGKEKLELGRQRQSNIYDLSGEYGIGYCSNTGNQFLFDLEDYDKIKDYFWYENDQGYALAHIGDKQVRMHRMILSPNDDFDVDHIFHNKLDNRKSKLRICTRQQNIFNSTIRETNKSGTTGVWFSEDVQKWRSQITVDGKDIILGWFKDINDAIVARKQAEIKYFGEYRYKENVNNE